MLRRSKINMSPAELEAFLDEERVVTCATIGPNGRPHLMPLWYFVDGTTLTTWTFAKSQKVKNLERLPRATLQVEAGNLYVELRGAMMECDVEVTHDPEGVADYGVSLFERYGPGGELAPEVREMVRFLLSPDFGAGIVRTGEIGQAFRHAEGVAGDDEAPRCPHAID